MDSTWMAWMISLAQSFNKITYWSEFIHWRQHRSLFISNLSFESLINGLSLLSFSLFSFQSWSESTLWFTFQKNSVSFYYNSVPPLQQYCPPSITIVCPSMTMVCHSITISYLLYCTYSDEENDLPLISAQNDIPFKLHPISITKSSSWLTKNDTFSYTQSMFLDYTLLRCHFKTFVMFLTKCSVYTCFCPSQGSFEECHNCSIHIIYDKHYA